MSFLSSVPLPLVSLTSPHATTKWPPRQHSVRDIERLDKDSISTFCRPPHDAIPNCRADLPLCERDIRPVRPLGEVHSYRSTSGIRVDLGHGLEKRDQMAGRPCETSHEHGVSAWSQVSRDATETEASRRSWSRNSKYLLTTSKDWNVIIWDIETAAEVDPCQRKRTIRFDAPIVSGSFHPKNWLVNMGLF